MTMRIVTVFCCTSLLASGCSSPPESDAAGPFRAIGSVEELMRALTIPSSDAVFKAQGETPQDAAAWSRLQTNALILAESGNLLMIGERARDTGTWRKDARALIDAAVGAVNAARARNAEQLEQAADAIYNACEGCHKDYLPK
jgi:cytochrome c556